MGDIGLVTEAIGGQLELIGFSDRPVDMESVYLVHLGCFYN